MNIDWKRKLTSRKFWVAVIGFVTALMLGFGVAESTAAEITAIITAGATLIAYIVGEGLVDASGKTSENTISVDEANEIAEKAAEASVIAVLGGFEAANEGMGE